MHGAGGATIELCKGFTEKERVAFCQRRYERRMAVEVYDGKRLTEVLCRYIFDDMLENEF